MPLGLGVGAGEQVLLHVVLPVPLLCGEEAPEYTGSVITETGYGGTIWLAEGQHGTNTTPHTAPQPPPASGRVG